jgi:hypothetical protein
MIVSVQHLEKAVSKLKYSLLGYSLAEKVDLKVTISLIQADPGTGIMVDCLMLKATAPSEEREPNKETFMIIELFPATDGQLPRASKTETTILDGKY